MIQEYHFFGEPVIHFDDSESVKSLLKYAFQEFGYYEPAGMDIVTVFQAHHPKTNTGWLTLDTCKICGEEIVNNKELCFAYYLPNCFYFAEGGWGHHMIELGNHPDIPHPVAMNIRFDDFDNTVVVNGNYCLRDVVSYLRQTQYISGECNKVKVLPVGIPEDYCIPFYDRIFTVKLFDLEEALQEYTNKRFPNRSSVYHNILEFK